MGDPCVCLACKHVLLHELRVVAGIEAMMAACKIGLPLGAMQTGLLHHSIEA